MGVGNGRRLSYIYIYIYIYYMCIYYMCVYIICVYIICVYTICVKSCPSIFTHNQVATTTTSMLLLLSIDPQRYSRPCQHTTYPPTHTYTRTHARTCVAGSPPPDTRDCSSAVLDNGHSVASAPVRPTAFAPSTPCRN